MKFLFIVYRRTEQIVTYLALPAPLQEFLDPPMNRRRLEAKISNGMIDTMYKDVVIIAQIE